MKASKDDVALGAINDTFKAENKPMDTSLTCQKWLLACCMDLYSEIDCQTANHPCWIKSSDLFSPTGDPSMHHPICYFVGSAIGRSYWNAQKQPPLLPLAKRASMYCTDSNFYFGINAAEASRPQIHTRNTWHQSFSSGHVYD